MASFRVGKQVNVGDEVERHCRGRCQAGRAGTISGARRAGLSPEDEENAS
jgi:hypothetical protein